MNNYLQNELLSIARETMEEKIGSIEASGKLIRLSYELGIADDDLFNIFRALDSQTDHLPTGNRRENYSPEMLHEIDEEIKDYEQFYKEDIREACAGIIKKYAAENNPD